MLAELAALMGAANADVLAHMGFPAHHPAKIHSINPLERLNGGIKRRSEVVGVFPNEAAGPAWSAPSSPSKMVNGRSNAPET